MHQIYEVILPKPTIFIVNNSMAKVKKFWGSIIDADNTTSSKRLITLLISLHFVLASFVILYLVCYVIMFLPKGKVEPVLLDALGKVLEYDFYIILSGLGFITSEGVVKMFISKNTPPPIQNDDPYNSYGSNQYPIPDPPTQEENNTP